MKNEIIHGDCLEVMHIGIELSEEYCHLIKKRMDNFQQTIFSVGVT